MLCLELERPPAKGKGMLCQGVFTFIQMLIFKLNVGQQDILKTDN
jgi:hypothetical protein